LVEFYFLFFYYTTHSVVDLYLIKRKNNNTTTTPNNCANTIQTGISPGQIELSVNAVMNIEIKKTAVIIFLPSHNALR
jgi:hypothetical protein